MRVPCSRGLPSRNGTTLVETAFIASLFLLFLFGTVEYCRFIFFKQIFDNAAREGARYAVVNAVDSTVDADTTAEVMRRLAGTNRSVRNLVIQVYLADSTGASAGPGTANNATFGQYIGVQIDCDYSPILPSFLFLPSTLKIRSKALMFSEAN